MQCHDEMVGSGLEKKLAPASTSDKMAGKHAVNLIILTAACAGLFATLDRSIFSVGLLPIKQELGLTATEEASLFSAFLIGYSLTNVPGGVLAERMDGVKVLLGGLLLWSLAVVALPLSMDAPAPLVTMLALRTLFGFTSGVALPSLFSVVAQWLPPDERASGVGVIMGFFNMGSAVGFLMGALIPVLGWRGLFYTAGAAGVSLSVLGLLAFPMLLRSAGAHRQDQRASSSGFEEFREFLSWRVAGQIACMIYLHCVINLAFFVFQNWLPKYMVKDLGMDLSNSSYLTALPFAVLAMCSTIAGRTADVMLHYGWEALRIRQCMVGLSTLVPAICLLCLSYIKEPMSACAILVIALAAHGFNNAGYHSHVVDVAPRKAGVILGFTNTVGVSVGIVAQLVTGYLVEKTGSFRIIFNLTAAMYVSGFTIFCAFMQGGPLLGSSEEEKLNSLRGSRSDKV